jgi:hypothetical protein
MLRLSSVLWSLTRRKSEVLLYILVPAEISPCHVTHHTLLQAGEAWKPPNKAVLRRVSGPMWQKNTSVLFLLFKRLIKIVLLVAAY